VGFDTLRTMDHSPLLPVEQAEVVRSPEGTAYIWAPRRGLLVTRVTRMLSQRAGLAMDRAFRQSLADAAVYHGFHDWEAMTDYDQGARTRLTQSALDFRSVKQRHHMLIGSSVVSFGMRAASAVLPWFHTYPDRTSFEAALRDVLQEGPK
jgi:hypothetical protein